MFDELRVSPTNPGTLPPAPRSSCENLGRATDSSKAFATTQRRAGCQEQRYRKFVSFQCVKLRKQLDRTKVIQKPAQDQVGLSSAYAEHLS